MTQNGPRRPNRFNRNGFDVTRRIEAIEIVIELERDTLQNMMTDFVCLKHFIPINFQ